MSRSAYGRSPCWICGRVISAAGFAQYNHKMMHVRRGEMTVIRKQLESVKFLLHTPRFTITDKGHEARKRRLQTESETL